MILGSNPIVRAFYKRGPRSWANSKWQNMHQYYCSYSR